MSGSGADLGSSGKHTREIYAPNGIIDFTLESNLHEVSGRPSEGYIATPTKPRQSKPPPYDAQLTEGRENRRQLKLPVNVEVLSGESIFPGRIQLAAEHVIWRDAGEPVTASRSTQSHRKVKRLRYTTTSMIGIWTFFENWTKATSFREGSRIQGGVQQTMRPRS
jgi:hypothetical protein